MTIRNRLTYTFTLLVTIILILFSFAVYYSSSSYREADCYRRLKGRAITTAKRLINTKGISSELLKEIDKSAVSALNSVNRGKVTLYDSGNREIYTSNDQEKIEAPSAELFNRIRSEEDVHFHAGEKQVVGVLFTAKNEKFVVVASGIDEYGLEELYHLKIILIIGLLITISVTWLAGFLFSGQALKPISNVVKEVDNITANNLDLRVSEGNGTDEIAQLAIKFNKMLARLEDAFQMQRSFVSNASHELRTPLTVIGGQIEVALMNKKKAEEYELILQSVWEDIRKLNALSNGLLELAQASLDVSKIKLKDLRIDEIVWQSRDELLKRQKEYAIDIEYKELPEDEKKLTVFGNEQLLKTAIMNVIDNACKYSANKHATIKIGFDDKFVQIQFIDEGIGIPEADLKNIFAPFYRTSVSRTIAGHGIGLSLSEKIVDIHKGKISLTSVINKGTTVAVTLPLGAS